MSSEKDQYKAILPKFSLEKEAEVKDHADSWIRGSEQR